MVDFNVGDVSCRSGGNKTRRRISRVLMGGSLLEAERVSDIQGITKIFLQSKGKKEMSIIGV